MLTILLAMLVLSNLNLSLEEKNRARTKATALRFQNYGLNVNTNKKISYNKLKGLYRNMVSKQKENSYWRKIFVTY